MVTPTASDGTHSTFDRWQEGDICDNPFEIEADQTCTADFTPDRHTLTVTVNGNGDVTSDAGSIACPDTDCDDVYTHGDEVQLTAAADSGWSFTGWTIDLTGAANPDTVTMIEDKSVTATLSPPTIEQINQPPEAFIHTPDFNQLFLTTDSIFFSGGANDPEDGSLGGLQLVWTSSLSGQIGTGVNFSVALGAGSHVITLTATDDGGGAGSAIRIITVNEPEVEVVPPTPTPVPTPEITPEPTETPTPEPTATPEEGGSGNGNLGGTGTPPTATPTPTPVTVGPTAQPTATPDSPQETATPPVQPTTQPTVAGPTPTPPTGSDNGDGEGNGGGVGTGGNDGLSSGLIAGIIAAIIAIMIALMYYDIKRRRGQVA